MTRRAWTLRRKLVAGAATLVASGLLVTGVTTILALQSFVFDRLDEQVLEGLQFATRPGGGGGENGGQNQPNDGGDDGGPAQRVGSLQVVLGASGADRSTYTTDDGTEISLTPAQVDLLEATELQAGVPTTVDLGEPLGEFRVAERTADGATVIAGNSLEDVTATTTALTVILLSVGGVTLLLVVVGLSLVVRRNLQPLDRVADVAQRVAGRQLADGAVEIPERVDESDTDSHTEVGRVGNALNVLLGHIEAALASRQHSEDQLRRFIADASHELRTPLASISGYAQLSLSEGASMTQTQERSFDRIAGESERMSSLVDDLLLLARLDAGQTLRHDTVDLTLLAIDAVSDAHAADPTREWRLDVEEEQIAVDGDENRIRQIVANLLRNARTHTPPGTTVVTALTRDETHAIIRVIDDGPGIDPTVRDRLFERFARGDHSRNRDAGSTGLGLSIAHAIVSAHGGEISVSGVPGNTVFTVRLPY